VSKYLWDEQKGKYASEKGINLMIDDEPDYAEAFSTPFLLFKGSKNSNMFKYANKS
jgi:hypothetical protein